MSIRRAGTSPGAFDLTGMRVSQTATDVYIQVTIRNLTQTFGNTFGAQLLDLYVHDPSAATPPTAAPAAAATTRSRRPTRGVSGSRSAGLRLADAGSAPAAARRTPRSVRRRRPSGTATIDPAALGFGTVGSGWMFTVALTGQDGFSADQARTFAPTPQRSSSASARPGLQPDLQRGPGNGAEGDGHDPAGRRHAGERARSDACAGGAARCERAVTVS